MANKFISTKGETGCRLEKASQSRKLKIVAAITLNFLFGVDSLAISNHAVSNNSEISVSSKCITKSCPDIYDNLQENTAPKKMAEIKVPLRRLLKPPSSPKSINLPKNSSPLSSKRSISKAIPPHLLNAPAILSPSEGIDESYPDCSKPFIGGKVLGIVGVSGGRNFTLNPCLDKEISLFTEPELYINSDYTGINYSRKYNGSPKKCPPNNELCLAYDYGFHAGAEAYNYAKRQGVTSKTIWLDVETSNSWNKNPGFNIQSISGEIEAIKDSFHPSSLGIYSTSYQWGIITAGNQHDIGWKNNLPVWYATAQPDAEKAKTYCVSHSFTDGLVKMVQFGGSSYDQDVEC